ncbi:helix-turn-helix domain-containing protein [Gordonia pseudamarae]|jgi:AraC-like DNA-binding protein|uniref:Helix-turn-helix domain-containing protein n=2 Tax=Gordoniaceae TaxID=85026 RepID=A0ABX6IHN6_9ACTN|nr:helix-turn-helix domain-containing protein [Gordonia pseudamarae]QHN35177.1 helix-turn-helix domain-containing protein [Gordonia pseudamarae]
MPCDSHCLTERDGFLTIYDMSDLIRATSLTHISELIIDAGGDPAEMFALVGFDRSIEPAFGAFVPYSKLAQLMNTAATTLGIADFGLQLSRYQDFAMFGPVSVLIRNARTLDEALTGLIRYLYTYTPAVVASARGKSAELSAFTWKYRVRRMPQTAQLTELTAAVVLDMLERITGGEFTPVRIRMTHQQLSSDATYGRHFTCPIEFEADANEIIFLAADLDRPISGDQQAYLLAEQYLTSQVHHDKPSGQVREILIKLLPLGEADLASVAAAMLVHPRTLQRRLHNEGLGFEEVLAEVRRTRAIELLQTTELPMAVIARELGYAEQSSFARSCVRWCGASPSAVRRRALMR